MSRGGGRGGRGGGRGGRPQLPWVEDPHLKVDGRPAEAFPPYEVPIPSAVTARERSQVRSFLLFREQVHDGPLYTAARTYKPSTSGASTPRAYGQEQINQRYGVKSKANIDPFTAVEMRETRLRRPERALPDFSERPFSKHLFPPELHSTIEDEDGPAHKKRKKTMTLSKVTALRTAEEIFNMPDVNGGGEVVEEKDKQQKLLEAFDQLGEEGGEDELDFDLDDEETYEQEMDEQYDDSDGGDYDAELYFDNGDNDDMGDGDDGDGGMY